MKEDKEKFEVTLDVSQFKPEELKVSTVNNVLSIEGKHEEEVIFFCKLYLSNLETEIEETRAIMVRLTYMRPRVRIPTMESIFYVLFN